MRFLPSSNQILISISIAIAFTLNCSASPVQTQSQDAGAVKTGQSNIRGSTTNKTRSSSRQDGAIRADGPNDHQENFCEFARGSESDLDISVSIEVRLFLL